MRHQVNAYSPIARMAPRRLRDDAEQIVAERFAVCEAQLQAMGAAPHGPQGFNPRDRRGIRQASVKQLRQNVRQRRYGSLGMTVLFWILGAIVEWAIKRWLEKRFPDR